MEGPLDRPPDAPQSKLNHYLIGFQATPMKPMRKDMAAFNCFMGVWSALPSYYGGARPIAGPIFSSASIRTLPRAWPT